MKSDYRRGVVAIFINAKKETLIFERTDFVGEWQFVQGGIESGESDEKALAREILEETGIHTFAVKAKSKLTHKYEWPKKAQKKKGRLGQEMRFFCCELTTQPEPDLAISDKCFGAYKWVSLSEALENLVDFKQECFSAGLRDLGLL